MIDPDFSGFDWDDGNRSKCQKHGMTIAEIEHVLIHHSTLLVPSPKGDGEARIMAIGRTPRGRLAMVVFTPRIRQGAVLLRPLSARFMHLREARKYGKEVSGS
jgi:uncharacterized DUF497 family protein